MKSKKQLNWVDEITFTTNSCFLIQLYLCKTKKTEFVAKTQFFFFTFFGPDSVVLKSRVTENYGFLYLSLTEKNMKIFILKIKRRNAQDLLFRIRLAITMFIGTSCIL